MRLSFAWCLEQQSDFLNGILISYGKVPAFIVTLGSMQAVRGLAQIINGGQAVSGFPLEIGAVMKTKLFGVIPIGVLYVIVILCSNDPDSFLYKIWTPYLRAWRK